MNKKWRGEDVDLSGFDEEEEGGLEEALPKRGIIRPFLITPSSPFNARQEQGRGEGEDEESIIKQIESDGNLHYNPISQRWEGTDDIDLSGFDSEEDSDGIRNHNDIPLASGGEKITGAPSTILVLPSSSSPQHRPPEQALQVINVMHMEGAQQSPPPLNRRVNLLRKSKEERFAQSRDSITSNDFVFEAGDKPASTSSFVDIRHDLGNGSDFLFEEEEGGGGGGGGAIVMDDSPLAGEKPSVVGPILIKPLGGGPGQHFKLSLARQNSQQGGRAGVPTSTNSDSKAMVYNPELQRWEGGDVDMSGFAGENDENDLGAPNELNIHQPLQRKEDTSKRIMMATDLDQEEAKRLTKELVRAYECFDIPLDMRKSSTPAVNKSTATTPKSARQKKSPNVSSPSSTNRKKDSVSNFVSPSSVTTSARNTTSTSIDILKTREEQKSRRVASELLSLSHDGATRATSLSSSCHEGRRASLEDRPSRLDDTYCRGAGTEVSSSNHKKRTPMKRAPSAPPRQRPSQVLGAVDFMLSAAMRRSFLVCEKEHEEDMIAFLGSKLFMKAQELGIERMSSTLSRVNRGILMTGSPDQSATILEDSEIAKKVKGASVLRRASSSVIGHNGPQRRDKRGVSPRRRIPSPKSVVSPTSGCSNGKISPGFSFGLGGGKVSPRPISRGTGSDSSSSTTRTKATPTIATKTAPQNWGPPAATGASPLLNTAMRKRLFSGDQATPSTTSGARDGTSKGRSKEEMSLMTNSASHTHAWQRPGPVVVSDIKSSAVKDSRSKLEKTPGGANEGSMTPRLSYVNELVAREGWSVATSVLQEKQLVKMLKCKRGHTELSIRSAVPGLQHALSTDLS